jgi:hypothetical protein
MLCVAEWIYRILINYGHFFSFFLIISKCIVFVMLRLILFCELCRSRWGEVESN